MRREPRNRPRQASEIGVDGVPARRERAIAELAGRQRGVVTRTQLRDAGLTDHSIDHRLRSGRLHRLFHGVYLLGHASQLEGARELGAVLACGPGAVLSHLSAAGRWRLLPSRPGPIDVTVPGRRCDPRRGIRIHRTRALDPRDVRKLDGIPVTTPGRTLLDLAAVASSRELEQAFAEAQARRLVRRSDLASLIARVGPRPGVPALRSLLGVGSAPALTRSEAEERFLALVRAAELPTPETNVRVGRYEVDFPVAPPRVDRRGRRLPLPLLTYRIRAGPSPGRGAGVAGLPGDPRHLAPDS